MYIYIYIYIVCVVSEQGSISRLQTKLRVLRIDVILCIFKEGFDI